MKPDVSQRISQFSFVADRGNTNAQLYVVNTEHGCTGSKIIDESVFQWIKEN